MLLLWRNSSPPDTLFVNAAYLQVVSQVIPCIQFFRATCSTNFYRFCVCCMPGSFHPLSFLDPNNIRQLWALRSITRFELGSLSSGEGNSEVEHGNAAVETCPSCPPVSRPLFNNRLSCATSPSVQCRGTACIVCPNKMQIVSHLFKSHCGPLCVPSRLHNYNNLSCKYYMVYHLNYLRPWHAGGVLQSERILWTQELLLWDRILQCNVAVKGLLLLHRFRGAVGVKSLFGYVYPDRFSLFSSVLLVKYWNITSE